MNFKLTIEAQLMLLVTALVISVSLVLAAFYYWLDDIYLAAVIGIAVIMPATLWVVRYYMHPINKVLSALHDGFQNILDNDFSVSLAKTRDDELGHLVETYNKVSDALRNERMYIYQRELLLDTVIQTTPLSLILVDNTDVVIYSNSAGRQLFNSGKAINGYSFNQMLTQMPAPFAQSVNSGLNGLFTVKLDEGKCDKAHSDSAPDKAKESQSETYHLTQNQFLLNGKKHQLFLFKVLTKEMNRQEVNVWKKVIRLISHELNNSLAPISSLAHSGQILSKQSNQSKLESIFETVEERAKHLQHFIDGYAKFARLPLPQNQLIQILDFFENLQNIQPFNFINNSTSESFLADPTQLQQAIINLVKNAHESGSLPKEVELIFNLSNDYIDITVKDRGKGMSEKHLTNALLPFYSTKANGTGLGLPLCREIIEAHGGKILISNRNKGGLKVSLLLPQISVH